MKILEEGREQKSHRSKCLKINEHHNYALLSDLKNSHIQNTRKVHDVEACENALLYRNVNMMTSAIPLVLRNIDTAEITKFLTFF